MTMPIVDESQYPEVLEKAADILESETVGWCKGIYYEGRPDSPPISACAFGAIRLAIVNVRYGPDVQWVTRDLDHPPTWLMDVEFDVGSKLREYMAREIPLPVKCEFGTIYEWDGIHELNDLEDTTKEQVIEVMKATAKELRNNANQ
jgi:hypothetical protein